MINPPLQLDEAKIADLEAYANPADVRWDLHAFADYVRDHEIKRGHRDNRIPQTHLQRLAKLMSDPALAAEADEWGVSPWIAHVDWLCLALKFVNYDTKGEYAGYSSTEPSYPDNYVELDERQYERFVHLPLAVQEERILDLHLGGWGGGGNEFFERGPLTRLDPFDGWGSATGIVPAIPFAKVRRRLLELLGQCPCGVWLSTASLVEHLRRHDPWFLIPKDIPAKVAADGPSKGRYGNFIERQRGDWGNRTSISDKDPEGFAKVEGRFLERFLEGLPLVLGYVEVAYTRMKKEHALEPSRGLLPAFRITERLRRVLRHEIAAPKVTVLPNFEVHVESLFFPAETERQLRLLGESVQQGLVTVFKLSKSKVAAAMVAHPAESAIGTLKALSGRDLPANVEQELRDWAGHSEKFILYEGFGLLEGCREAAGADSFVVEAISPDFALVRSAAKLFEHLEATEQVPGSIRHSDQALSAPERVRSRLAPGVRTPCAPDQKPAKVKRRVQTTLWFADAEAHAAFCKILLDAKGMVSIDRRALTVSYPRPAESLVQACLKKLNEAYTVAMEDLEQ